MAPQRKEGSGKDERAEGSDPPLGGDASEEFREIDGSRPQGTTRTPGGLAERLRDVLRGESDGDLLLERRDVESGVLQWLRALDLQVLGACRADERLRPLLKLNVSSGAAEDRLITQLSQHFEASEVGMLARCLCAPLVSIRVGKVNKQGNLLCPTATRGHLNLTLLPSSKMRISFIGDDACTERLAIVSNDSDSLDVIIEEISADSSSRSFLLKLPGSPVLYYWCSEKSEIYGKELLAKMKDLLRRKPTLSHLTGISESRLNSFATHLRAYLLGSSNIAEANSTASSNSSLRTTSPLESDSQSSPMVSKSSRLRSTAAHMGKAHPFHQGSLSPRSNTFKDGMPRTLSSIRNGAREKLKRLGENHLGLSTINIQHVTSVPICATNARSTRQCEDDNSGDSGCCGSVPRSLPDMSCLASSLSSFNPLSIYVPPSQVPIPSSLFTPYYCWCPPCSSSLQYTITPQHLPSATTESLPLPPLSPLLPAVGPPVSMVQTKMSIDAAELNSLSFPALFPDPLVRLPLPVSSLVTLPNSQQIPTFTPFMSDPIVHIPVIDVCSSGQGYLVSAGPAISSAIPPLLPSLVNPLIPETESLVEKGARETLRMLMASAPTPTTPQLVKVLPAVLSSVNENFSCINVSKHDVVASSCGPCLCDRTVDIDTVASEMSLIGLYPLEKGVVDEGGSAKTTNQEENGNSDRDGSLPKS